MIIEVLTNRLQEHYDSQERDGVHVSDLTLCLRKAVFKKLNPSPITMREVNFFTSGSAIHTAIQTLAQYEKDRFDIEKSIEFEGIVGHIDLFDKINNVPVECKSSRVKEVKEPKAFHVDQLKCYMAITGADKGVVLYQCLMHFDDKPFQEFEITMTEEERNKQKESMIIRKEYYKKALDKKDPFSIDGVMGNKDLDWLCKGCPHLQACKDHEEKKNG